MIPEESASSSAHVSAAPLDVWLASDAALDRATFVAVWAAPGAGVAAAYDRFHTEVLRHVRSHPPTALRAVERAQQHVHVKLDPHRRARLQRLHAHVLAVVGRLAEASSRYARAWRALARLHDPREQFVTGLGWISTLGQMGEIEQARGVAQRCRRLLRGPAGRGREGSVLRARLDSNHADVLFWCGRSSAAARGYAAARRRLLRAGHLQDASLTTYNLGMALLLDGQTIRARRCFEDALARFEARGARVQALYARFGLAWTDVLSGRYRAGVESLEQLQTGLDATGDRRATAATLRRQAEVLGAVGALEAAEPLAARALSEYRAAGLRRDAAHAAFLHGRLLAAAGRWIDARVRFADCAAWCQRADDTWALRRTQVELAAVQMAGGDGAGALELLRRVTPALERHDRSGAGVRCRQLLADLHLRAGRAAAAVRVASAAYADATALPLRLQRPHLALTLAHACRASGDPRGARRWARRAVLDLEAIQLAFGSRRLRSLAGPTHELVYQQAIDLVLELGGPRAARLALDLIGRARAPRLVEDLMQRRRAPGEALRSSIARVRDELLDLGTAGPTTPRAMALRAKLAALDRQLARHLDSPPVIVRRALRARSVRAWSACAADRRIVVFHHGREGWHAFVVEPRGHSVRRVPLPHLGAALRESWVPLRLLLEQAAHVTAARREAFLSRTQREAMEGLRALRHALWDPLQIDRGAVVVVPAAELHGLPIESLPLVEDEAADAGRVPRECPVVCRLPHPALLTRPVRPRGGAALLLHDGRAGTAAEVERVRTLLQRQGVPVQVGSRVGDLRRFRASPRLIHVAAHGSYSRDEWILSGIRLSDGWLGLEELHGRRARDAAVVLGSCESGLENGLPGAALDGWLTAGLGAGAREMVLALWKIDDASALAFAEEFYPRWCAGGSAAAAVAHARRAVRDRLPHPFSWAAWLAAGAT